MSSRNDPPSACLHYPSTDDCEVILHPPRSYTIELIGDLLAAMKAALELEGVQKMTSSILIRKFMRLKLSSGMFVGKCPHGRRTTTLRRPDYLVRGGSSVRRVIVRTQGTIHAVRD